MPVSSGHLTVYSHDYSKLAPASQNYRYQALKQLQPASAIKQSPLKVLTLSLSPRPTLFGWKDGQKATRCSRSSRRSLSLGLSLTSFTLHQSLWHNKASLKFTRRLAYFSLMPQLSTKWLAPWTRGRDAGGETAVPVRQRRPSAPLPRSGAGPSPNNTGKTVNKTPDEWLVWISALLISVTITLWKTAPGILGPGCLCLSKHRAALYDTVQIGISHFTDLMCTAL